MEFLWILLSGSPWRDLPERYEDWKNTHRRFSRWSKSEIWEKVFIVLTRDSDNEYISIDSTIVRAHQHSTGARGKKRPGLGRSRGGKTVIPPSRRRKKKRRYWKSTINAGIK